MKNNDYSAVCKRKAHKAIGLWIRQMEFVKNAEPKLAVAFLRKACGYERYLRVRVHMMKKSDLTEWEEILNYITEDAGRYRSAKEWQEAQELYREQLQCRETVRSGMQKKQENRKKRDNSADGTCGKGTGVRQCVDPRL